MLPILRYMAVVVATEAARGVDVPDMGGVGAPGDLHGGKGIRRPRVLRSAYCAIDLRHVDAAACAVKLAKMRIDAIHGRGTIRVRLSDRGNSFPPHKRQLAWNETLGKCVVDRAHGAWRKRMRRPVVAVHALHPLPYAGGDLLRVRTVREVLTDVSCTVAKAHIRD